MCQVFFNGNALLFLQKNIEQILGFDSGLGVLFIILIKQCIKICQKNIDIYSS